MEITREAVESMEPGLTMRNTLAKKENLAQIGKEPKDTLGLSSSALKQMYFDAFDEMDADGAKPGKKAAGKKAAGKKATGKKATGKKAEKQEPAGNDDGILAIATTCAELDTKVDNLMEGVEQCLKNQRLLLLYGKVIFEAVTGESIGDEPEDLLAVMGGDDDDDSEDD